MIREELLHPVLSHFPIAMFSLALVTKLLELLLRKAKREFQLKLNFVSKFLIYLAPLFFLVSMYLGDSSFEIIKSEFCDLALVSKHEDLAYFALYFFLGTLIFESLSEFLKKFELLLQVGAFITLLFGNYYLFKTAHLGGELVYEKGAAVKVAPKCN